MSIFLAIVSISLLLTLLNNWLRNFYSGFYTLSVIIDTLWFPSRHTYNPCNTKTRYQEIWTVLQSHKVPDIPWCCKFDDVNLLQVRHNRNRSSYASHVESLPRWCGVTHQIKVGIRQWRILNCRVFPMHMPDIQ